MTGDGMQDIVMIFYNQVSYWPNLGYGRFGKRVIMRTGISLPFDFDPKRLILGDIDGDGCSDIAYVENGKLRLWINRNGNSFSDEILINGTPQTSNIDSVRICDLNGSGTSGLLWTAAAGPQGATSFYMDLHDGNKPYLLQQMDNNMGSITKVEYKSSIYYYLQDQARPETRWNTELPFPVLVVSKVEAIDAISQGKLTTLYSYHHGYWDGFEREFRGFGRVEQLDTETFEVFNANGLGKNTPFNGVSPSQYTPPTLTKSWFHQGAMGDPYGGFYEADYSMEFWSGDPQGLSRPAEITAFLQSLSAWDKRDALRTLRGTVLRTEMFGLDDTSYANRPYTVTEAVSGMREEVKDADTSLQSMLFHRLYKIFFPFGISQRSTQWERGTDPMTSVSLTGMYDAYGQAKAHASLGVPRGGDWRKGGGSTEAYLATLSFGDFIYINTDTQYMVDRGLYSKSWDATGSSSTDAISYLNSLIDLLSSISSLTLPLISHSLNFYDGTAFTGLSYGNIGIHGTLIRTETLIITDEIVNEVYGADIPPCFDQGQTNDPNWDAYPDGFVNSLQDPTLGYTYQSGGHYVTGYYTCPSTAKFDFQDGSILKPRGLLLATKDTFGAQTTIEYDSYDLMAVLLTDAMGMRTSAQYDYRVMQPDIITDPNENRKLAAYSPLGLLFKSAVQGKIGENKGDTLDHPTSFLEYDFFAFMYSPNPNLLEPIWVKTHLRERHWYDDPTSPYIVKYDYSDGFGRQVQSRAQAEDVLLGDTPTGDSGLPADQTAPNENCVGHDNTDTTGTELNVIVSGWQVYNNKGKVVEKFEPFFEKGFAFDASKDYQYGQKVQMFYDPRGQLIRTLNSDGTEQKIVFGIPYDLIDPDNYAPTNWVSCEYDANDLTSTEVAYGTPKFNYVDALGRTIKTYEKNKYYDYSATHSVVLEQDITMHYAFDIRGNLLVVTDALGRVAFDNTYDLKPKAGGKDKGANLLRTVHIDGGKKISLIDALNIQIMNYDNKGSVILHNYDIGNRPTKIWARDNDTTGEEITLRIIIEYGESVTGGITENLNGKVYKQYDEAGLETFHTYDFKGNVLSKERNVIRDVDLLSNGYKAFIVDWQGSYTLEGSYLTDMEYDALNHITQVKYPEDVEGYRRIMIPTYNKAGGLEKVDMQHDGTGTTTINYVQRIAYNARGQRLLLALGNGVMTRYTYDPKNFRLLRMKSERFDFATGNNLIYEPRSGTTRQDFAYSYDPLGNIIRINDETPNGGISGTTGLERDFDYDSLYRLLQATGRENPPYIAYPAWEDDYRSDTAASTVGYTQQYEYDEMGNILSFANYATGNNFVRYYHYPTGMAKNLLGSMTVGGNTYSYDYDANGNIIQENTERHFGWDYTDKMCTFANRIGTGDPTVFSNYLYDAGGNRVKKFVQNTATGYAWSSTTYIDSIFEYCTNDDSEKQNTLHIMDDKMRIATHRIGDDMGDTTPEIKYILSDHLGSSNVLLDDTGSKINREEYYPFGETSFGSYAKKRYRFCGKERDEESGLYYYGMRYYMPWICRFVSIDPLAAKYPFYTSYQYASNKPIISVDINGMEGNKDTGQGKDTKSGGKSQPNTTGVDQKYIDDPTLVRPNEGPSQYAKRLGIKLNDLVRLNKDTVFPHGLKPGTYMLHPGQKLITGKEPKSISSNTANKFKPTGDFQAKADIDHTFVDHSGNDPSKKLRQAEENAPWFNFHGFRFKLFAFDGGIWIYSKSGDSGTDADGNSNGRPSSSMDFDSMPLISLSEANLSKIKGFLKEWKALQKGNDWLLKTAAKALEGYSQLHDAIEEVDKQKSLWENNPFYKPQDGDTVKCRICKSYYLYSSDTVHNFHSLDEKFLDSSKILFKKYFETH